MPAMLARPLALAALFALVPPFLGPGPLSASTSTCEPFGTVAIDGGAIYQQNEWNSTATQCASVDPSTGAWSLTQADFDLPTNRAPATYPATFRGCHWGDCSGDASFPVRVSDISSATSSWSTTQVSSGAYDVAYDIWTNTASSASGQPDGSEIMIWLNSRGGVQPAGSKVDTVQLSGATWDVWTTRMGGWNYVAYRRTQGVTSVSDLNVKAFLDDSVARGSTDPSWYLLDAEAGFEIWQGGLGLGSAPFSFDVSGGGSSGGSSSGSDVSVKYRTDDADPHDSSIQPGLDLVNRGSAAPDLSGITLRYWFTRDGAKRFDTWCDYAAIDCGWITERVRQLRHPRRHADAYPEVGFTGRSLAPGESTGELLLRLNARDWSELDENDDYSYGPSSSFQTWRHVGVYRDGTLIWGRRPPRR